MLPLIKVLEAPPPKPKIPVNDYDTEEEKEEGEPEHVGNVSGHDINVLYFFNQTHTVCSLVPRLSGTQNVHVWRAWYIFYVSMT